MNDTNKADSQAPLRVIVLYSAGHLGSTMILNRLLTMPGEAEFDAYFRRRRFFRIRDTFASILNWRR